MHGYAVRWMGRLPHPTAVLHKRGLRGGVGGLQALGESAVLHMTEAERVRLSRGFGRTFLTLDRLERLKEGPNS